MSVGNEINRLKQELSTVCEERDKYAKMVQQAGKFGQWNSALYYLLWFVAGWINISTLAGSLSTAVLVVSLNFRRMFVILQQRTAYYVLLFLFVAVVTPNVLSHMSMKIPADASMSNSSTLTESNVQPTITTSAPITAATDRLPGQGDYYRCLWRKS